MCQTMLFCPCIQTLTSLMGNFINIRRHEGMHDHLQTIVTCRWPGPASLGMQDHCCDLCSSTSWVTRNTVSAVVLCCNM